MISGEWLIHVHSITLSTLVQTSPIPLVRPDRTPYIQVLHWVLMLSLRHWIGSKCWMKRGCPECPVTGNAKTGSVLLTRLSAPPGHILALRHDCFPRWGDKRLKQLRASLPIWPITQPSDQLCCFGWGKTTETYLSLHVNGNYPNLHLNLP